MIIKSEHEKLEDALINIVLESWRFAKSYKDMLSKLDAENYSRYCGRYSYFRKKLDEIINSLNLKLVEISQGTDYDIGMAVTPINISDFNSDDLLQIEQMLEPIIICDGSIIKTGSVILSKKL